MKDKQAIINKINTLGKSYNNLWCFLQREVKFHVTNNIVANKSEISFCNIGRENNEMLNLLNIIGNINDDKLEDLFKILEDISFKGISYNSPVLFGPIYDRPIANQVDVNDEWYRIINILQNVIDYNLKLNYVYSRYVCDYYIKNCKYEFISTEYLTVSYLVMKDENPLFYERSIVFGDDYTGIAENINNEIKILNHQSNSLKMYSPKGICLMENRVVYYFIKALADALISFKIKDNLSFFANAKNDSKEILDNYVTLTDDPLLKNGLKRHVYDFEGVPCKKKILIKNGKINDFLSDINDSKILNCSSGNAFASLPEFNKAIVPTNLVLSIDNNANEHDKIDFIFDYLDMSFNFNNITGDMNGIIWGRKLSGNDTGYCRISINDNVVDFLKNIQGYGENHFYSGYNFPLLIKVF
jgi:hypothetical protein